MARRVGFFVIAALVCLAVAPVTKADLRWVPEVLAGTYGVLALLALLDGLGRRRL
jgi:hypothetical protein